MTMQDLLNEIVAQSRKLDVALSELGKRGRSYAEAERKYRVGLKQKILIERDKGTPVTIISDICRGSEEIASLRFDRDVSEIMYKSALEAINVYKLQLRLLENQADREWHSG